MQPMHVLEISSNFRVDKDLNNANDLKLAVPLKSVGRDLLKNTVAIFLTEVLYKSIKEREPQPELFEYLLTSIKLLDETEFNANFHLVFLMNLSKYLGFYPSVSARESDKYFNLEAGVFENTGTLGHNHLDEQQSRNFKTLIGTKFDGIGHLNLGNQDRRKLLRNVIRFYELQLGLKASSIASLEVFEVVFQS